MRAISAVLSATLLLAACQPAAEDAERAAREPTGAAGADQYAPASPTDRPAIAAPRDPDTASQRLPAGEYRVAGADGADVNLPHAITVSVSDDTIAVASQCVTPRWTYRYVDGRLRTEPVIEPICDRGRYPAEEALAAVFGDPQQITRTAANGLLITGGGHSVTLFTQ